MAKFEHIKSQIENLVNDSSNQNEMIVLNEEEMKKMSKELKLKYYLSMSFQNLDLNILIHSIKLLMILPEYDLANYKKKFVNTKDTLGYVADGTKTSVSTKRNDKVLPLTSFRKGSAYDVTIFFPNISIMTGFLLSQFGIGWNSLVIKYHNKLVLLRSFIFHLWKDSGCAPFQEIYQVHPLVKKFLQELVNEFSPSSTSASDTSLIVKRTSEAATTLTGELLVKLVSIPQATPESPKEYERRTLRFSGNTDLLIVPSQMGDVVPLTDLEATLIHCEVKSPFGALYHSGCFAERDQLLAETKLLSKQLEKDQMACGLLFDLFVGTFGFDVHTVNATTFQESFIFTPRITNPSEIITIFMWMVLMKLRKITMDEELLSQFGKIGTDKDNADKDDGEDNNNVDKKGDQNDSGDTDHFLPEDVNHYQRKDNQKRKFDQINKGDRKAGEIECDVGFDSGEDYSEEEEDYDSDFVYQIKDDEEEERQAAYRYLDMIEKLQEGCLPLREENLSKLASNPTNMLKLLNF